MHWLLCSGAGDYISDFNIRNTKNASNYFISDSDKIYNRDTYTKTIPSVRKLKTLQ